MPNKRAEGQRPVLIPMKEEFVKIIDKYSESEGLSRSQLLRDAVYEKLESLGARVPKDVRYAPGRRGKGGKRKPGSAQPAKPSSTE